jgi:hypothetical protein
LKEEYPKQFVRLWQILHGQMKEDFLGFELEEILIVPNVKIQKTEE